MLLLQLMLAFPVVWTATQVAGVEDDVRDIFNVALFAVLGPLALEILAITFAIGLESKATLVLRILAACFSGVIQLVLTALAAKRLLTCTWRQAWIIGIVTAGAFLLFSFIALYQVSATRVD